MTLCICGSTHSMCPHILYSRTNALPTFFPHPISLGMQQRVNPHCLPHPRYWVWHVVEQQFLLRSASVRQGAAVCPMAALRLKPVLCRGLYPAPSRPRPGLCLSSTLNPGQSRKLRSGHHARRLVNRLVLVRRHPHPPPRKGCAPNWETPLSSSFLSSQPHCRWTGVRILCPSRQAREKSTRTWWTWFQSFLQDSFDRTSEELGTPEVGSSWREVRWGTGQGRGKRSMTAPSTSSTSGKRLK